MSMGLMPLITQSYQGASQSYSKIMPDISTKPEKTIGGGIQSGVGGALAGAMLGAEIGAIGGPWGAAGGAALGLAAYYLS